MDESDEKRELRERLAVLEAEVERLRARERELEQARASAEKEISSRAEHLASLSHEIKTPLNGIMGMAEIGQESVPDDGELESLFLSIKRECRAIQAVLEEVLDHSRMEAGQLNLETIPFDLGYLMEDVGESLSYRARRKGLVLDCLVDPATPLKLVGDPGRLRQVLVNLVDNAVKYTPSGKVSVKVEPEPKRPKGTAGVSFRVRDTGVGIPLDEQERIFSRFCRASGASSLAEGHGLGLSIVRRIVTAMGGEISLKSAPDQGTEVAFTALFARDTAHQPPVAPDQGDLRGLCGLVVDDSLTDRRILAEYLDDLGCLVDHAEGAGLALAMLGRKIAAAGSYDYIVIDVRMPGMDGFALVKEIRALQELGDVPILVITSAGRPGDARLCRRLGVQAYLTKPIRREDLRRALTWMLRCPLAPPGPGRERLITAHSIAEDIRRETLVLVVEDDPTSRQVAAHQLKNSGFQVDTAGDGVHALAMFRRKPYHVVVTDVRLPGMDGLSAVRAMRREESSGGRGRAVIIGLSGLSKEEDRGLCLRAGMDEVLGKPMSRDNLISAIEKRLEKKSSAPQALSTLTGNGPGEPPMDQASALAACDGDRAFLSRMGHGFLNQAGERIEKLRRALDAGDLELVELESHPLMGGALDLKAHPLARAARELEERAKAGDPAAATAAFQLLLRELGRLRIHIDSFLTAD